MKRESPEVANVRRSAGIFETLSRNILSIQGKDRHSFLHNLLSHDIKGISPGQGRPACLLDRHGKILFAAFVHARPEELLLELDSASGQIAKRQLDQYLISEEAQIEDHSDRFRILPLHGPRTFELIQKLFPGLQVPEGPRNHTQGLEETGIRLIVRTDLFRMPGIHLWVEPKHEQPIRKALLEAGAPLGIQPASREVFEVLRIEAGVPWPGKELTDSVILNELGDEEWVSFTKGCFIGQEIVARIKHRAHPPRLLRGWRLQGETIPQPNSPIRLDSQEVGILTSACYSPTLGCVVALGFLKFGVESPQFQITTPTGSIPAQITPLPFVE